MADIIPAVLPATYKELKEKLSVLVDGISLVHIDVTDGTLTSSRSWPYSKDTSEWESIQKEEAGFPYWEEFNFEAHLMVRDIDMVYEDWIRAGAERLIVHHEAFENDEEVSNFLLKLQQRFSGPNEHLKIEIGLAVSFDTPVEKILDHVLECDFIHLMAIPELGSQGEPFEEGIFDKIRTLRSSYPESIIAVDGGVSMENAERLVEAGVGRLVVGSAIWKTEDPLTALDDLIIEAE